MCSFSPDSVRQCRPYQRRRETRPRSATVAYLRQLVDYDSLQPKDYNHLSNFSSPSHLLHHTSWQVNRPTAPGQPAPSTPSTPLPPVTPQTTDTPPRQATPPQLATPPRDASTAREATPPLETLEEEEAEPCVSVMQLMAGNGAQNSVY